ncbi:MAG: TldD/PmbA family protein [Eubacterium sp.]|nr:TldD/PmbA family protein [Eubacterium sp.]
MATISEISKNAIDYLKSKEGVKGDINVSFTEQHEVTIKDGKLTLLRTLFDNDINIKVIKDSKLGKVRLNDPSDESIKNGIDDAIKTAESGNEDEAFDIAPGMEPETFKIGVIEPDIEKLIERTIELSEEIKTKHKNVKVMEMFANHIKGHSIFANTFGTRDETEYGYYELVLEYAGNDGEKTGGICFSQTAIKDLDKPFIELGSIDKDLSDAENSIEPISVSDKFEGDVIFTPDCSKKMLNFLLGNTIDDSVVLEKTSLWLEKLGQQVVSPKLTISSKPWDDRIVDFEVHTSDGFRSKDYTAIENGILKSFAVSQYTSNKTGIKRADNSALSFVVEPGDISYEEMIKGVKKGLIVGDVSCGYPGINCEISGVAKNAFLVEDGKIVGAVKETMVSGNLIDMFNNVKAISKEQISSGYTVIPYIQVGGVTISGS